MVARSSGPSVANIAIAVTMNDRGELIEHVIDEASGLNPTALDLLAHMCVANIAIAVSPSAQTSASPCAGVLSCSNKTIFAG